MSHPRAGRAERPKIGREVAVGQAHGCGMRGPSRRIESVEREPKRGEHDRDVVELSQDGNEARDEVDRRGEVAGRSQAGFEALRD